MSDTEPFQFAEALDRIWECPRCGSQVGHQATGEFRPTCGWGHPATEMEQRLRSAWRTPEEQREFIEGDEGAGEV